MSWANMRVDAAPEVWFFPRLNSSPQSAKNSHQGWASRTSRTQPTPALATKASSAQIRRVPQPTGLAVIHGTASDLADALHDRYVIERELGRGGMATVYLARDLAATAKPGLRRLPARVQHVTSVRRLEPPAAGFLPSASGWSCGACRDSPGACGGDPLRLPASERNVLRA